jgi:exopolyphosphatase/guanosine-5'-triphosphate,3'-diphosphate pyrophosphatase
MESYRVGSLVWSQRYFPDGQLSHKHFQKAQIAAAAVLEGATNVYQAANWSRAYGSAGTVSAIGDILVQAGWPADKIDQEGLDWLLDTLVAAQQVERIKLPGLREDRRPILAGGLSVLRALFDLLHIDTLEIAQGGLRHGLICDMLGERDATSDLRDTTVARLASKFQVDAAHARRVGLVATALYRQLYPVPQNGQRTRWDRALRKLGWAAQLHEIGTHISHSDYHKHGAYILDNADALGFAFAEMQRLGILVLGHRGKLRKVEAELEEETLRMQLSTLRLAVILCHARRDPEIQDIVLCHDANGMLSLRYPGAWALKYPQSAYLLQEEVMAWQKTTWTLECREDNP